MSTKYEEAPFLIWAESCGKGANDSDDQSITEQDNFPKAGMRRK